MFAVPDEADDTLSEISGRLLTIARVEAMPHNPDLELQALRSQVRELLAVTIQLAAVVRELAN